jgi:hypothetical protein
MKKISATDKEYARFSDDRPQSFIELNILALLLATTKPSPTSKSRQKK